MVLLKYIFDRFDLETVSQTFWTQKQYSIANFCMAYHIWKIVTKIDSMPPYMGNVCHLGTIAMHRTTIFMPTIVIGQGTEILV